MSQSCAKEAAIISGKKTYISEKKCNKCDGLERYSKTGDCAICARSRNADKWKDPSFSKADTARRRIARNSDPIKMAKKREQNKQWADKNKEKQRAAIKCWSQKNPERVREKSNEWRREQYSKNPEYKMRVAISGMIRRVISRSDNEKTGKSEQLLGYSKNELVNHIEKQFTKGMNWDNYGSFWHIDHITPLSIMLKTGADASTINCLSNLMPIEAEKNLIKSNKVEFLI